MNWYGINRADFRGLALYERHYSARVYKDGRKRKQYAPPGSPMCLLTVKCDALFGWVKNKIPRKDGQVGINCFVFRNESAVLSSQLIREADALAWQRWPEDGRHFTYVDPEKVGDAEKNPGYCFIKAGWRRAGKSKRGLLILEIVATEALP